MALTQISTKGIKDGTISSADLSDQSVTLDKLPHGTSSNDGKFLRANNGADPSFETVTVATATGNANVIQTTDGSGAFTASNTFTISGDVFTGHDISLARDSSNAEPVVGASGGSANVTFRTNQNNASGAGVASILDLSGLQMGRMTQYVKLAAPTDQAGQTSYTFTFPPISGTNGQALTTNGSGTTSWTTIDTDLVNDTSPQLGGNLDTNNNSILLNDSNGTTNRILLGTASDMRIYHDGSDSYIDDGGTGGLKIRSSQIIARRYDNNAELFTATAGGSIDLYHNGSKKFETTSYGASVTGTLLASGNISLSTTGSFRGDDNAKLDLGSSNDLQIYHDGTVGNNIILANSGDLNIRTNNSENSIVARQNGAVELYHNNNIKLETKDYGVEFHGDTVHDDNLKAVFGNANDLRIYHDGTHSIIEETQNGNLVLKTNQTGTYATIVLQAGEENSVICHKNGNVELYFDQSKKFETTTAGVTVTGALTATGDVTAFSDETLKKDITTIENAIDICSKLRGVSYKWIKDDKASIGVIAQEVEKVIPEVVHTTEHEGAEVKSVDYGKIIGVLINAINEQQAKWDEWMELLKEIKKMENKLIEVIGNY